MSALSQVWKSYRNSICGAALFLSSPAAVQAGIPSQCYDNGILMLNPVFASVCNDAITLQDALNGKINLRNQLRREYDTLESQYNAAVSIFKDLEQQIEDLRSLIDRVQSTIEEQAKKRNVLQDARRQWKEYEDKIKSEKESAERHVAQAIGQINETIQKYDFQNKLIDKAIDALADGLNKLGIDKGVKLGTLQTEFMFSINPISGTVWFEGSLPGGVKISTIDLEAMATGHFTMPSFDPVEVALTELPIRKTETYNWNNWVGSPEVGNKNFNYYLCSERFSDFFGADQVGSDAISAILTGGASAPGALERAKRNLVLEWSDILIWARSAGEKRIEAAASNLIWNIIKKRRGKWDPAINIGGQLETINYEYRLDLDISHTLPVIGQLVRDRGPSVKLGEYSIPHVGCAIWAKDQFPDKSPQQLADELFQRVGSFDAIAEVSQAAAGLNLDLKEINWIRSIQPNELGLNGSNLGALFSDYFGKLFDGNGGDLREILRSKASQFHVVDLTGTQAHKYIETQLGELTPIKPDITKLTIDLRTGRIAANGMLDMELSVGSAFSLLKQFRKWGDVQKGPTNKLIQGWTGVRDGKPVDFAGLEGLGNFSEYAGYLGQQRRVISDKVTKLADAASHLLGINKELEPLIRALSSNIESVEKFAVQHDNLIPSYNEAVDRADALLGPLNAKGADLNGVIDDINDYVGRIDNLRFPSSVRVPGDIQRFPGRVTREAERAGKRVENEVRRAKKKVKKVFRSLGF